MNSHHSAPATAQKAEKTISIEWRMKQLPQDGFLAEMGTGLEVSHNGLGIDPTGRFRGGTGGGRAELTLREIYWYMWRGATIYEAARMSGFKGIEEWERDVDFQRATTKCSAKFQKVLELIESQNMKPADVIKLLKNGITDDLLASSTLTEEQTLSVFSRFKYSHFTASKTSKEIPAMMDALLAGALPFNLFESGYDKVSVAKLCNDLYGEPGKKSELSESEREEIKSSPETITLLMELMKIHQPTEPYYDPFRDIGVTYRALKEHGEEAVRTVHPETLMVKLRDGSTMGTTGATTTDGFIRYVESTGTFKYVDSTTTAMSASVGNGTRSGFRLNRSQIVELIDAGLTDAGIVQLIFNRGMTFEQAMEYAKDNSAPLLIEGDL